MNVVLDFVTHNLNRIKDTYVENGCFESADVIEEAIKMYRDGWVDISFKDGEPVFSLSPEAKSAVNREKK